MGLEVNTNNTNNNNRNNRNNKDKKLFLPNNIDKKDTNIFIPPISKGIIIDIIDVNTLIIATKIPEISDKLYRFTIDLKNIKVPSVRSKNSHEKRFAKEAKEYLKQLCLNDSVTLKNIDIKNNRLEAEIYSNNLHINNWLIQMGYAITKNKDIPIDWHIYRLNYLSSRW